jgi:peptidyl-prolyl cis-trans isomerase C
MLAAELASAPAVTAEEVDQFYAGHPAEFQRGERVRAQHILIRVDGGGDPAARERAREQAAAILAPVKGGGDFDALARQHSQDPGSAPTGGDLGYFERGQMVGPFEDAAFALAPSQTSELVESQFGYHIIKMVDRQPGGTIPLVDVRPQIEEFLREERRAERTDAFIESLKARSRVDIYF